MSPRWGRFTAVGGKEVEDRVAALTKDVADLIECDFPPESYRALVMIGGYGRGEGGVERHGGRELPHNNVDFLLVMNNGYGQVKADCEASTRERLRQAGRNHQIGVDFSFTTVGTLRHSPCLIMWYDMRYGHKTVLGDATFVPSLDRFRVGRILPSDARNLLVNRGTLLVLNDVLLRRGNLTQEEKRTVVRHSMKAIIGYGDALLFSRGLYHWSYRTRQRRMWTLSNVNPHFRSLYDEAMEFRFLPRYDAFLNRDIRTWNNDIRRVLESINLICEAKRLGQRATDWSSYSMLTVRAEPTVDGLGIANLVRRIRNVFRRSSPSGHRRAAPFRLRTGGPPAVLAFAFPVVAYGIKSMAYREAARAALGARSIALEDLRRAYFAWWERFGDTNLSNTFPEVLVGHAKTRVS